VFKNFRYQKLSILFFQWFKKKMSKKYTSIYLNKTFSKQKNILNKEKLQTIENSIIENYDLKTLVKIDMEYVKIIPTNKKSIMHTPDKSSRLLSL
jgi:hypothetical protein